MELTSKDFKDYHDNKPWYGKSVMAVLNGIQLSSLESSKQRSILSILAHLVQWKKFILEKLRDNSEFSIKVDSKDDWPSYDHGDQQEFDRLRNECSEIHSQILQLMDQGIAMHDLVDGRYRKHFMVLGLMQHDIYHIGQIALLAK